MVDALLDAGVTVYVIAPAQVKGLRGRYGAAGNKDDHYDAYLLADTVRTDRHRLTPLAQDSQPTVALRTMVRSRRDPVAHRVAVANQLRAHLDIALPGVVGMFHDIDSPISRTFLAAFPTQHDVDSLTLDGLAGWLKAVHYNDRTQPAVLFTG